MAIPAVPMNSVTFLVIAGVFSLAGFHIGRFFYSGPKRMIFGGLFGCTSGFALMCLLMAIDYIPNDWSANRLTWSAGFYYGYHLYLGENGPSNGFFYPPFGAWFYLPAAGLGILLSSPITALTLGWIMSLASLLIPLLVLLHRINAKKYHPQLLVTFLVALCIIFSCPSLRYVATMIHVDSPALLFLGLTIVLILPLGPKEAYGTSILPWAGACLALAIFSKQSIWPIVPLEVAIVAFFYKKQGAIQLLISALLSFLLLLSVLLFSENFTEAFRMILQLPSHQITATSAFAAARQLLADSFPVCGLCLIIIIACLLGRWRIANSLVKASTVCFILAFWMIPFAILTRMRFGADSNHLAIPVYLALLGCVTLLPTVISKLFQLQPNIPSIFFSLGVIILITISLSDYLSKPCDWFLWYNNSQQQALQYELHSHRRIYYPWQVYSMLIAEKKLYPLDDCIRYERAAGWKRSDDSLKKYLPEMPFQIAIRPFGNPSYLAQKWNFQPIASIPQLPQWEIYSDGH